MAVRSNIEATHAASESRATLNTNAARANWHNVLEVTDATATLAAAGENPETLYDGIRGTANAAAAEVELPPLSASEDGRVLFVLVDDADPTNDFTLTPDGSDTIDGGASHVFTAAGSGVLRADNGGTNWEWALGPF